MDKNEILYWSPRLQLLPQQIIYNSYSSPSTVTMQHFFHLKHQSPSNSNFYTHHWYTVIQCGGNMGISVSSILPKDTLLCDLEELRIKPLTFWLVDDLLYSTSSTEVTLSSVKLQWPPETNPDHPHRFHGQVRPTQCYCGVPKKVNAEFVLFIMCTGRWWNVRVALLRKVKVMNFLSGCFCLEIIARHTSVCVVIIPRQYKRWVFVYS